MGENLSSSARAATTTDRHGSEDLASGPGVTRLAPSPTGALHLGNARTFLITWAMARQRGWRIILRIEDLDTPRVKAGAMESLIGTLAWLGMDWDPPIVGPRENPLVQSRDLEPYRAAIRSLAERGLAYPCELTRAQIEQAASAPQEGSHEVAFPSTLRPDFAGAPMAFDFVQRDALGGKGEGANWRFLCPSGAVEFDDRFAGPSAYNPSESVGDFILWTKRDQPSYQLAVVVDDCRQGVNRVVRGDDLRESAARQMLLYRALGYEGEERGRLYAERGGTQEGLHAERGGIQERLHAEREGTQIQIPEYWHLPLVIGADGRRLAKRHGDTRVEMYRERGVPREAIVGLIASWSIPGVDRTPMSPDEFRARFDPATMPRIPIVFTPEDDAWLLSRSGHR